MSWQVSEATGSGSNPDRAQLIGTSDNVLVVSNDFATQQSIVSVLLSAGIDAVGTAGPEATAIQVIFHPAVAIVEHVPPANGGLTLAQEIKDRDPAISILLLTDPSLVSSAEGFDRAAGRLVKPLEPDAFLQAVREALETRHRNGIAEPAPSPAQESEPETITSDSNSSTDTQVTHRGGPSGQPEEPRAPEAAAVPDVPPPATASPDSGPDLVSHEPLVESATEAVPIEAENEEESLLAGSEAMQFAAQVPDSGAEDGEEEPGSSVEEAERTEPELAEAPKPERAEDLQPEPAEQVPERDSIADSVIEAEPDAAGEEDGHIVATKIDEAAQQGTHRVVQDSEMVRDSEFAHVAGAPAELHLDDRLRNSLATLVPRRRAAAVFLVQVQLPNGYDLDGFSHREAVFGSVYERLSSSRRRADTVVTAGQGRFMVVCADVDTTVAAEAIAASIVRRLSDPVAIGATDVKVNSTVGVVMTTIEDGGVLAAGELIEESLLALRLADEEGRPWKLLDVVADDGIRSREQLPPESDDGELRFAVQKVVDPQTRATLGAEARLRWRRPRAKAIWASRFADRAREANLAMLGRLVLERAEIASWRARELIAEALPPASESSSALPRKWSSSLRRRWTKRT